MSVCDLAGGANKKQKPAPAKKPALAVATSIAETLAKKAKEEKQEEQKAAKEKKREEEKEGKKKEAKTAKEKKQEEEKAAKEKKREEEEEGKKKAKGQKEKEGKQEKQTGEKKNEEKKQEKEKAVKGKKKEEEEEGKKADEKGKPVEAQGKKEVEEQEQDVVPLGKPPAQQINPNMIKINAQVQQTSVQCGSFSVTSLISTVMDAAAKRATDKGSVFPEDAVMAAGLHPLDHDPVDPAKTISDALMTRGTKHFIGDSALEKKACSVFVYHRIEFQGMRTGTNTRRR